MRVGWDESGRSVGGGWEDSGRRVGGAWEQGKKKMKRVGGA